jgi:penicillin-binding protein 1C
VTGAEPTVFRAARRVLVVLLALGACGFLLFLTLDRLFPFPMQRLERPAAIRVVARDGTPLRVFLPSDGILRIPVSLDEVSPEMVAALVSAEDRWFGVHPGVNPLAVLRALWQNARARRVVSGASTIPMQVARLVERRRRTLAAKLVES